MKTKYIFTLILAIALLAQSASAQAPIQSMNANLSMADEASFLNPAYLKNTSKLQINFAPLMNFHFQTANSLLATTDFINILKNSDKDNSVESAINKALDNVKSQNTVNTMLDLTLLHVTYQFGKKESPWHVGVSIRQHIQSQVMVNEAFLRLLLKGNKQYAGSTVSLEPDFNSLSYADFGIAASRSLTYKGFTITPAIRLSYLMGEAAIYTNHTAINLYTQKDGEYIDMSGQLNGYAGGMVNFGEIINNDKSEDNHISKTPAGKGIGFDLGVSVEYKNFSLSIASIDNGKIKFKGKSAWYVNTQNVSYKWDGYDITANLNGQESAENFTPFDSLNLKASQKDFVVNIGSKFTLNANYGYKKQVSKKGVSYFKHNVGFSLIAGSKSRFNPEIPTWLTLYYQYNLANHFTAGINYNRCLGIGDIGLNVGMRIASLDIGLGTNSLLAAFGSEKSKKADLFFHLGLAF